MGMLRSGRVIIKIANSYEHHHSDIGDLSLSSLGIETIIRSRDWRLAKGLEIDLYYQGITNIRESTTKFD